MLFVTCTVERMVVWEKRVGEERHIVRGGKDKGWVSAGRGEGQRGWRGRRG